MRDGRSNSLIGRRGFAARIDTELATRIRRAADDHGLEQWKVVERLLELGLRQLGPIDEPLPYFAYDHTRQRGRPGELLFSQIRVEVIAAVRHAAGQRHAHVWWVAQEAFQLGLPLLPAPTTTLALANREELLRSA